MNKVVRMPRAPALSGLLLVAALGGARAEQAPALSLFDKIALRDACSADLSKACGQIEPGGGRVKQCATAHFAEFSQPCQSKLIELGIVPQPAPAPTK